MTEARVRTFKGSEVTLNKKIDWRGDTQVRLENPFGNGQDYLVQHEPRLDGYVNLFELNKDQDQVKIDDVSPEERREYYDQDPTRSLRITHHGEPRKISKLKR